MERWEDELVITFRDFESEGYATPSPANAVLITNDPSHYVGADAIGTWRDSLWVRCYTASAPRVQHPGTDVVERLLVAHKQRVTPPSEFHESP